MTRPYLTAIYNETLAKWVELPMPSAYQGTTSTLVNTSRNASGEFIGSVVRSGFAKVEMTIPYLTVAQYATMLQLFEPNDLYTNPVTGSFVNWVKFFDQVTGAYRYREMYVSDRGAGMMSFRDVNGVATPYSWNNVSLSLVDCGKKEGDIPNGPMAYIGADGAIRVDS